eukprot:CAMPEP_0204187766 /NCGR_PEP_ID=MMETSP0361-20130328/57086_1 /ASSEMBLY_ACC=CAM_ASM_000343 /TAXON_ID=268821 /ORGANISM="Scrippsiella Hangoei, Strain SHTV-5" /LENGTH=111 /DNA_ID=CAMNT_0051148221 /DNA_START=23 /DNA_END=354 /DNA_ORIENTATION=-
MAVLGYCICSCPERATPLDCREGRASTAHAALEMWTSVALWIRGNTECGCIGLWMAILMLMTATALVHRVSATTPYAFMAAELVVQEPCARLWLQWWKDVCRKEEMRSENL